MTANVYPELRHADIVYSMDTYSNGRSNDAQQLPILTSDDAQDVDALELEFDHEEELVAQLQLFWRDESKSENYR